MKIGFIGQGWIGKNYALDFEERGYSTVRYGKEPEYEHNKEAISECDIVFIAVPTPTTPHGFDDSILYDVLPLIGKGKIAVIKSTILPGVTEKLQEKNPNILVIHSPEFLSEATAKHDTSYPFVNIVGVAKDTPAHRQAAETVLSVLPKAPSSVMCTSTEAEIIKYSHNCSGFVQIIFFNIMYNLATTLGCDWQMIKKGIDADPMIPNRYAEPIHKSGRGAGGHCFIKDFAALIEIYKKTLPQDLTSQAVLLANQEKNIELLLSSKKDLDLLFGVYGNRVHSKEKKESIHLEPDLV